MKNFLHHVLSLIASYAEMVWLYLQLWALRAEIHGMQLMHWVAANPDGALGTAAGLAGAFVLATSTRRQALGWWLFLASNAGMIALGMRLQRPDIVLLQGGFTITSMLGIYRTAVQPSLQWDEWRGDFAGNVTMRIKHLASWRGRRLDLHQMIGADPDGCYHSHPARAIRLILWNGYVEEIETPESENTMHLVGWRPLQFGVVLPELSHRIAWLRGKVSYSLWLRGPKTNETQLRGPGWSAEERAQNA